MTKWDSDMVWLSPIHRSSKLSFHPIPSPLRQWECWKNA